MLFSMQMLRFRGQKRAPESRKAHFQGHLVLDGDRAMLVSDVDGKILYWLEPAAVRKITREGILIVGREASINPGELWPQAWWCTPPQPEPPLEPGQITRAPLI